MTTKVLCVAVLSSCGVFPGISAHNGVQVLYERVMKRGRQITGVITMAPSTAVTYWYGMTFGSDPTCQEQSRLFIIGVTSIRYRIFQEVSPVAVVAVAVSACEVSTRRGVVHCADKSGTPYSIVQSMT